MDDLSDDLLLEILARVPMTTLICPAKAAAVLRTLSRRWNSIISSRDYIPRFISLGEENNCPWGNGEALLFSYMSCLKGAPVYPMLPSQCDPSTIAALDFSYILDDQYVIGASEDLLLLKPCSVPTGSLVVCNPFSKRWVALPTLPFSLNKKFAVVCEPQGHRYRVVCMDRYGDLEHVFVSETGEWEEVQWMTKHEYKSPINILSLNGKLYWHIYREHVVAYDPFEDSLSIFPDPSPEDTYYARRRLLGVVHGSIRMLKFAAQGIDHEYFDDLIIWELDHNEGRWSLIFKSSSRNWLRSFSYTPVALHPYGHIVYFIGNQGLSFLDLSKGCNNVCKVAIKNEFEVTQPSPDTFLLTRPWRPTSVSYGSSR